MLLKKREMESVSFKFNSTFYFNFYIKEGPYKEPFKLTSCNITTSLLTANFNFSF